VSANPVRLRSMRGKRILGGEKVKVGLCAILPLLILYSVLHPKEGPGRGRVLRISRAIVLQSCVGNAGGGGNARMIACHTKSLK